ncbi:Hypothetical predicted protein [Pelobates cultripes]|uniref:Uncharacterized protein n=1 Tax=Pelobates cultripes TaxID=61616 RepID=A0AAD1WKY2_PELCU|nr:Hypothetical predicted protein [Pelobates cultripes]
MFCSTRPSIIPTVISKKAARWKKPSLSRITLMQLLIQNPLPGSAGHNILSLCSLFPQGMKGQIRKKGKK